MVEGRRGCVVRHVVREPNLFTRTHYHLFTSYIRICALSDLPKTRSPGSQQPSITPMSAPADHYTTLRISRCKRGTPRKVRMQCTPCDPQLAQCYRGLGVYLGFSIAQVLAPLNQ